MAGPIRIAVLASATGARKELAGTQKDLGNLGQAGERASGQLRQSLSQAGTIFARLRQEAEAHLDRIPKDAAGAIDRTSREFQELSPEMRRAVQDAARVASNELRSGAFRNAGQDAGDQAAEGFTSRLTDGIGAAKGKIGAALVALGVGQLFADALSQDANADRIGASLGLSDAEARRYGQTAGRLYAGAYADSVADAGNALASVRNSFRNLDGGELEATAERALNFASIFEIDVARAAQVAGQSVRNGLAKDATEAFDLLTAASQKVPPSLREDVLDAADEYGGFFRQIGYGGEQAFAVLARGAGKGMYGIDKAGDAVKEFGILVTTDLARTQPVIENLGLNYEATADALLAGGGKARRATNQIIDGLLAIESPSGRARAAVELFGTPLEDLGTAEIPRFLRGLKTSGDELGNFEGAADRAGKQLGDNAQTRLKQFGNGLKQDVTDRIVEALPEIEATARELQTTFGPALEAAVDIAKSAGKVFSALPEPVKQLAGFAGVAAFAIPRLTSAVTGVTSGLSAAGGVLGTFNRQTQAAGRHVDTTRSSVSRLGNVARGAGGAAGLGALALGATTSNDALGILANVGGGALLGFAAGGPIGGAVGGTVAALGALSSKTQQAADDAAAGRGTWEEYASTLDQVTAAATGQTRAFAYDKLVKSGAIQALAQYGVSARDAVDAAVGQAGAIRTVVTAVRQEETAISGLVAERDRLERAAANELATTGTVDQARQDQILTLEEEIEARRDVVDAIGNEIGQGQKAVKEKRKELAATRELGAGLKNLPKRVQTRLETTNAGASLTSVARLSRQYKLTPKEIRTLLRTTGVDGTLKDVRRVQKRLRETGQVRPSFRPYTGAVRSAIQLAAINAERGTGRVTKALGRTGRGARPNLSPYVGLVGRGVAAAERVTVRGTGGINRSLSRGTRAAKPDLGNYQRGVTTSIRVAERNASRGGEDVARGATQPVERARPNMSGYVGAIGSGVASARGIGSSGGFGVGAALQSGVINGFAGTQAQLSAAAASAVRGAIASARAAARSNSPSKEMFDFGQDFGMGGVLGVESMRGRMAKAGTKLVKSALAGAGRGVSSLQDLLKKLGKQYDRSEDRVNGVVRALKRQEKRLAANRRNVDRLTQGLKTSTTAYKDAVKARDEYAGSIRTSILESGSLTSIEEGHLNSPDALLRGRRALLANAERFDAAIRELRGKLNAADLQVLVDAGPAQGLAAAEALVSGLGSGVVDEINTLQSQLAKIGTDLGKTIAGDYKQAGVDAKRQLMNADKSSLATATRTGNKLATSLLKAFRDRLGLKNDKAFNRALFGGGGAGAGKNRARAAGKELARAQRNGFDAEQRKAQQRRARAQKTAAAVAVDTAVTATAATRASVDVKVRVTPAEMVNLFVLGQAITRAQRVYEDTKKR